MKEHPPPPCPHKAPRPPPDHPDNPDNSPDNSPTTPITDIPDNAPTYPDNPTTSPTYPDNPTARAQSFQNGEHGDSAKHETVMVPKALEAQLRPPSAGELASVRLLRGSWRVIFENES